MSDPEHPASFTPQSRQAFFLELAARPSGTTAQEVYEEGRKRGDTVTLEAYHNLGRRLAHRGLVVADRSERQTIYTLGAAVDGQWLDEEQLAAVIDPEYPLIALTVLREARRQLAEIPELVWEEVRTRLKGVASRDLFLDAIIAYANDLRDAFQEYIFQANIGPAGLAVLRNQIETSLIQLKHMTKHGLGLSDEAIRLPGSFSAGLERVQAHSNDNFYSLEALRDELERRIPPENMVVEIDAHPNEKNFLIAAVDGSSRGGLLTMEREDGDFSLGHAPSVSINTSIAQINRRVRVNGREHAAFLRLPEKPEDMQQQENRYTIMARMFYPDLSESKYVHSIWNAMNLLENRAAIRVMKRWYTTKDAIEVRPADVVMLDGTAIPNDRDSNHYAQPDAYGKIVRDLIETSCEIMQKSRDNDQVVLGVVKNAQLRVFGPVINHFITQTVAREKGSQIATWPIRTMNSLPDQVLLTRILTAGRRRGDAWLRTCFVLRPFHSATDFAERHSRDPSNRPAAQMMARGQDARDRKAAGKSRAEDDAWAEFLGEKDSFVQLLDNAWYANFFLGAVPRLDQKQTLPRMEILIPATTLEIGQFNSDVFKRGGIAIDSLRQEGFDVASEHSMFGARGFIDVLPRLLVEVHYTVKIWAAELQSRVQEYIGYHLSHYLKGGRGIRIRPWRRAELEAWVTQMTRDRRRQAGALSAQDDDSGPKLIP